MISSQADDMDIILVSGFRKVRINNIQDDDTSTSEESSILLPDMLRVSVDTTLKTIKLIKGK
eukprot:6453235-Ditylum_brightwellii.AAC.1